MNTQEEKIDHLMKACDINSFSSYNEFQDAEKIAWLICEAENTPGNIDLSSVATSRSLKKVGAVIAANVCLCNEEMHYKVKLKLVADIILSASKDLDHLALGEIINKTFDYLSISRFHQGDIAEAFARSAVDNKNDAQFKSIVKWLAHMCAPNNIGSHVIDAYEIIREIIAIDGTAQMLEKALTQEELSTIVFNRKLDGFEKYLNQEDRAKKFESDIGL